jgi:hypothetical protein
MIAGVDAEKFGFSHYRTRDGKLSPQGWNPGIRYIEFIILLRMAWNRDYIHQREFKCSAI